MATTAEIIAFAELQYPRVQDISTSNKIVLLNQIIDEVNNKLLRVRWENEPYQVNSVVGQAAYQLPTDCTPDNIIKVLVGEVGTTELDVNSEFDLFEYAGLLDNINLEYGNYYILQDNDIYIFKNAEPLQTTGLPIFIYYYRTPTYLNSVDDVPEIEIKYHNLMKYGLIQMVASIGDNPELQIADYWQRKFDEELMVAKMNLQDKFDNAPLKTRQIEEYW